MGQLNKLFVEDMLRSIEAGKFPNLTLWEFKQLGMAWQGLHGYRTWPGMPQGPRTEVVALEEAKAKAAQEWQRRKESFLKFYEGAPLATQCRLAHEEGFVSAVSPLVPIMPKDCAQYGCPPQQVCDYCQSGGKRRGT